MRQGRCGLRAHKRDRERGASLVEFALLLPVFSLLLFGMITAGITLTRQNSVENAVREATRFGAVNPLGSPANVGTYLGQVLDQAEAAATGDLANGTPGRALCAAFVQVGASSTTVTSLREDAAGVRTSGSTLCFSDSRSDQRIQVVARRSSDIDGVIYAQTVTLESRSVTRYER